MAQAGAHPASLGVTTAGGTAAKADTAAPRAPLSLLDLSDDMLEVIASAVDEPGAHVALLGICKRLRGAAYAAPCSLRVCTPRQAGWRVCRRLHLAAIARRGTRRRAPEPEEMGFPTETAAAAAHLLVSVMRFLSTHKQVQSLTLRRCTSMDADATADGGAGDHGGSGEDGAADGDEADAVVDSVKDRRQPCPHASGCHLLHLTASRALYTTSGQLSRCSKKCMFASCRHFLVRICHFSAAMPSAATGRF